MSALAPARDRRQPFCWYDRQRRFAVALW